MLLHPQTTHLLTYEPGEISSHTFKNSISNSLQNGILREYHTRVNTKLSWWWPETFGWNRPATFSIQRFLRHCNTSGISYFQHSNRTYKHKLNRQWSNRYWAIFDRETTRMKNTILKIERQRYYQFTSNHYKFLVSLREYNKQKKLTK